MLYRTLKRMIERKQTEGIEEKIDVFYAAGKLSQAEYDGLMGLLHPADGSGAPGASRPTDENGQAAEEG